MRSRTNHRVHLIAVILIMLAALLTACLDQAVIDTSPLATAVMRGKMPVSVAVLPFVDQTGTEGLAQEVRSSFYSHFSLRPYRDVELRVIDEKLARQKLPAPTSESVRRLGQLLGVDAVVFGTVDDFHRIYAAVYSQISVAAGISIWDTRTGAMLWQDQYEARSHEGGLPLSLLEIPLISIRSGWNLRDTEKIRVINDLSRHLAQNVPAPVDFSYDPQLLRPFRYEVNVGAFSVENSACELLSRLRNLGYPSAMRKQRLLCGPAWLVLVGPFESLAEAGALQHKLAQEIGTDSLIQRITIP